MDILSKKQSKNYDYVSRYSGIYFYYNKLDNKYMYGINKQLKEDSSFVYHKIEQEDTLDSLALKYYGRPDLFWIIADFNHLQDPFMDLKTIKSGMIKVPSISSLDFEFDLRD